jgi:hypothetical protein
MKDNAKSDLIIDFETFGVLESTCPIINCSAYVFDWEKFKVSPYTFEYLVSNVTTFKLCVKDQVKNHGYVIENDAVNFWEQQLPETRKQALPKKDDLTLSKFCSEFTKFLMESNKFDYWWSRNNAFDPVILKTAYRKMNSINVMNQYLKFWRVRDAPTYIDAKFDFSENPSFIPIEDEDYWNDNFKIHNSAHDIAADILRMQAIYRAENNLELTKR